ncbi:maleate cis-trans isomerase family protein [Coralliovum pocilloporae]|uniref:maleate cis-trans isomerase family protein n=1 Tax=Coralliovum pocilloporae TaxID=3066369 RepID=UPI003306BC55
MTEMNGRAAHRIGVLVPYTNTNLESDCVLMRPEGVSFHFARLGGYEIDAVPDAEQMLGLGHSDIAEPLKLIAGVRPDVVLYGCTSATLSIGPDFDRKLASDIENTIGAKTVTAASALVHALKTLGKTKIAFASPYTAPLNDDAIRFLARFEIETVSRADYPEALGNFGQGALPPEQVLELGMQANSDEAEVIVLSCTDMRSVEIIDHLEQSTGKPVITSNQAMLFQALQLLGETDFREGFGQLFTALSQPQR